MGAAPLKSPETIAPKREAAHGFGLSWGPSLHSGADTWQEGLTGCVRLSAFPDTASLFWRRAPRDWRTFDWELTVLP